MGIRNKAVITKWDIYYPKLVNYFTIYGHTNLPEQWKGDQSLSNWVLMVRKDFSSLQGIRKKALVKLNFIPYREWNWLQWYEQLAAFKKKYKHLRIPSDTTYYKLYDWLLRQRANKKKLSVKKLALLNKLKVLSDNSEYLEEKWQQRYKELLDYKRRFKDCNVPRHWKKNPLLGRWVARQRLLKSTGKLTFSRKILLTQIGFTWGTEDDTLRVGYYDKKWDKKYRMLEVYFKQYGHSVVAHEWQENPTLARWVSDQRMNRKNGKLTNEKIARLDKLTFAWNPLEAQWMENFYMLKAFYLQHGHTKIPVDGNTHSLAKWVSYTRTRKKELSKEKIVLMDSLSFNWKLSARTQVSWMEMYKQLMTFKKKYGHIRIGKNENQKLAKWLYDQRTERVKHSPERKALLEKTGLVFSDR